MNEEIVLISVFPGVGGLDVASVLAGVPVVSSIDFDSDCIQTVKQNEDFFGNTNIFEGNLHEIKSEVFMNYGIKDKVYK